MATQEPDGTIVLELRATADDGSIGDALIHYLPDDPNYAIIARHVGPIPPGRQVFVRPFPSAK